MCLYVEICKSIHRCRDAIGCHRWSNEDFVGKLQLQRCRYECYPPDEKRRRGKFPPAQADTPAFSEVVPTVEPILEDESAADEEDLGVIPLESDRTTSTETSMPRDPRANRKFPVRYRLSSFPSVLTRFFFAENSSWNSQNELPHVCYTDFKGRTVCHVFEDFGHGLSVNASLLQAINPEDTDDWCAYPVPQKFNCRVPADLGLRMSKSNQTCLVECQIQHPYDLEFGKNYLIQCAIRVSVKCGINRY